VAGEDARSGNTGSSESFRAIVLRFSAHVQTRCPARAVVPCSYMAITALWLRDAWASAGSSVVGMPRFEDSLLSIWYLAWWAHALSHFVNPLTTTAINYPVGVNLGWVGMGPLLGIAGWPLTSLWGPVAAYNLLLAVGLALTAWAVYSAIRPSVTHSFAAFVAGLAFLIGPYLYRESLSGDIAIAVVPLVPLAVVWGRWALVRQRGSPRLAGFVLGALVAGELLLNEEVAASMVVVAIVACVWLLILFRKQARVRMGRVVQTGAWAFATALVIVAVPVAWQYAAPGSVHGYIMPPSLYSGRLLGYLVPDVLQLLSVPAGYGLINFPGFTPVLFGNYVGIPLLAIVAVLCVSRWRLAEVRFFSVMFGTLAVLVLGAHLHLGGHGSATVFLPWAMVSKLPLLGSILPVRLSLYLDFFAVGLLAIALDQILSGPRPAWAAAVAAVMLASWLPMPVSMPVFAYPVPTYFQAPLRPLGQVLLVVPFAQSVGEAAAMEWQATSQMSFGMVDGYFTRTSGAFGRFYHGPPLNPLTWDFWTIEDGGVGPGLPIDRKFGFVPIARWLGRRDHYFARAEPLVTHSLRVFVSRYLRRHGVNAVVLGPCTEHRALEGFLVDLLGQPRRVGGVAVWHSGSLGWGA
jgi:hypothetical protein